MKATRLECDLVTRKAIRKINNSKEWLIELKIHTDFFANHDLIRIFTRVT